MELGGLDEVVEDAAGAASTINPKEGISGAGSSGAVTVTPRGRNRRRYFEVWDKISSGIFIFH